MAYEAYFNFSKTLFEPKVAVRGPNGTAFSRGNDKSFHFSKTTANWADEHRDGRREGLAYRPDAGLVSAWENPDLYGKLIREAGGLLEEKKGQPNEDVLGIWIRLNDHPRYGSRDCGIPLFTFDDSYP